MRVPFGNQQSEIVAGVIFEGSVFGLYNSQVVSKMRVQFGNRLRVESEKSVFD